jgi:hypothetical protein
MSMSWDVILLEEVDDWFFTLDTDAMAAVTGAIDLLEAEGPTLGRPTVDKVSGSKFHSMKELRPAGTVSGSCSSSIRCARRSCCSAVTRPATGKAGTTRTSRSPNGVTRTGWRSHPEVNEHGPQLA